MSFLARLSLKNRSLMALATIAILVIGAFVIPTLKEELFPSLDFPAVSIITVDPGASPSIVEHDVTNPLEQSIQGVANIQQMTSYSNQGVSIIVIEYNFGTDINQATQTLSQHINQAQASLPAGLTPQVQTFGVNSLPVIQLAVTSSTDPVTLAEQVNQQVVPVLQGINGVASASVTGVRQQVVTITLDLQKVQAAGLTVSQIEGVLQANNLTLPAGQITSNGQTLPIQVGNTFNSLDDLRNLVVGVALPSAANAAGAVPGAGAAPGGIPSLPGGVGAAAPVVPTPVTLGSVATVEQTLAPSSSITRTNGKPSIGIAITKTNDGNTVSISRDIRAKLASLRNTLGGDADIVVVFDQSPFVTNSVNGLISEGLIGAAFAILVILVFLLSLRSTLVTAVSIPLSVVIALIGLWAGQLSLNILTLGGLTIAIGRVVDDSIVVLENIQRHLRQDIGADKLTTIIGAVREVAGAVTASTLTTVCVFLPISFTGGLVGELFSSFAITVTIALLASLFVALTIIPVLAYWFLRVPGASASVTAQASRQKISVLERGYVPVVRWVTTHRVISIIGALAIFVGSIALVPRLGTNFFDNSSQNVLTITQTLPTSTSLDQTDQAASQVEAVLASIPGVQTYQATIGSSGTFASAFTGGSGSNSATFAVTTDPNANQATLQRTIQNKLNQLTGAGSLILSASGQGFNSSSLAVNVQASDEQTLRDATQMVVNAITQAPHTTDVTSNLADAAPLINVQINPTRALLHGLTAVQVGQNLRAIYSGTTITRVTLGGTQEDVDVRLGTPAATIADMEALLIPGPTGTVRLGDVATITQDYGPPQITHLGGVRTATVNATITISNVGAVSQDIQQRLNKLSLPSGATVSFGGVTSDQAQAFSSLLLALLIAIVLVFLVMVATFRSVIQPLILLVSIPFAATGSIVLLLLTHTTLGVPALIGLLMLVGIVVTNAIVLLDLVNQYRARGLDARAAVVEGSRRRLRPILMTAIATILALMPMALGLSSAGVFIAGPLAIVVIGGLATSTILTLLIVPTLYVTVEDIRERFGRGRAPVATPPPDGPLAPQPEPALEPSALA